ncbi:adenine nucleotide alpha hydrolases-like protein [Basidiobolus meristosporus CBS 931.73]|uniref:FAD synthase n=1 Tax=Basidiobolus meristosporus CBS 931.73 TaxID=1314790 RepID=A0A1Y1Y4R3_9FUNG|nr:adenine nucleotide alpha hydrolases-like protein [Basidiobolus meristosporus CBS 931.73]|eukprot:ORX92716.1 adenine nucleotide alpha hydrolases-like protein [Basidiobolus meristosporus CBS 931.73]
MVELKQVPSSTPERYLNGGGRFDFEVVYNKVYEASKRPTPLGQQVQKALQVIERALVLYGLEGLAISFNGGKDCTVLLHLLAAAIYSQHLEKGGTASDFPKRAIQSIYIRTPQPFVEVEDFVKLCVDWYGLDLLSTSGPMKAGLQYYLEQRPKIQGVLVGTRRTDPHGAKLAHFLPTDPGWPTMMRIHPIIDWNYPDIWDFLLKLDVPYCPLYEYGYTSLGCVNNTLPNPSLKNDDVPCGFSPAWMLLHGHQERDGR